MVCFIALFLGVVRRTEQLVYLSLPDTLFALYQAPSLKYNFQYFIFDRLRKLTFLNSSAPQRMGALKSWCERLMGGGNAQKRSDRTACLSSELHREEMDNVYLLYFCVWHYKKAVISCCCFFFVVMFSVRSMSRCKRLSLVVDAALAKVVQSVCIRPGVDRFIMRYVRRDQYVLTY